jgi:hypothetical protein
MFFVVGDLMPYRLYAIACILLAMSSPAYAYLDPGVGSFVLQMIVAGALATGAAIKMYWYRITSFWRTTIKGEKPSSGDQ